MGNLLYLVLAFGVFAVGLLLIWIRSKVGTMSRQSSVDGFREKMGALSNAPPAAVNRHTQPTNRAQPSGTVRPLPNEPEED